MPQKENPDGRDDEEDGDEDEGEFCAEVGCRAGSLPRTRPGRLLQKCLSSQAEELPENDTTWKTTVKLDLKRSNHKTK